MSPGLRYLSGHYTSVLQVFEGIGYQKWIATYLHYLIVCEIRGVPLIGCMSNERDIDFLLIKESCFNMFLL